MKRLLSLLISLMVAVTAFSVGPAFAASGGIYDRIRDLDDKEKTAIVGIVWYYIAEFNNGNINDIVSPIIEDMKAAGLDKSLEARGITGSEIRSTIERIQSNRATVEAIVNIISMTDNEAVQEVLDDLMNAGIISKEFKDLASSRLIALLDLYSRYGVPVFTNDSSGKIVVMENELADLASLFISILKGGEVSDVDKYISLALTAANIASHEINRSTDKAILIEVLKDFNLYKETSQGGGSSGGGSPGGGGGGGTIISDNESNAAAARNAIRDLSGNIDSTALNNIINSVEKLTEIVPANEREAVSVARIKTEALDSFESLIKRTSDSETQQKLAEQAAKLIDNIAKSVSSIESEDRAVEMADAIASVVQSAAKVAAASTGEAGQIVILEQVAAAVDSVTDLIAKIQLNDTAVNKVIDFISTASSIIGVSGTPAAQVKEELVLRKFNEIAASVITKVGKEKVEAVTSNDTAKVVLPDSMVNSLSNKMDQIVNAANTLNNAMNEINIPTSVDKVMTIEISTGAVKGMDVSLSAKVLEAARTKGIDRLEIRSEVADISMPPHVIPTSGASTVSLSARALDAAKDLTEEQRKIAGDSTVYDLDLTVTQNSGSREKISSFDAPVVVRLPYTLKANEDPEKITVFYLDDNGNLVNKIGKYDADSKSVIFETDHFSKYVVMAYNKSFNDMDGYEWARKYIEVMASKDAIAGMGDGTFNPGGKVTRAQFASIIVKALGLFDENATSDFTDVSRDEWYYKAVSSAVKAGIIVGYPDKTFKPDAEITRQDMAVMVRNAIIRYKKAFDPVSIEKALDFADQADIDDYAKPGAAIASKYQIITGRPGRIFAPKDLATRAEAAVIIYKVFNLD